jgi:NADH:ubiquinone reductase (H+-translocating)
MNDSPVPRVVIVGGGFGGLSAAKALRREAVDVTLIDRTNHFLFQPLLYQVATGLLSPADIAVPTRFLLRKHGNTTVLLGDVKTIDLERRIVRADDGLEVAYDYLIVAPGARHSYFGHDEWEPIAPGLKTLDDARQIRRRFLLALERAEKSTDPIEQESLLTFVVVGGGPTGVELAGILPTLARKGFRSDFRRLDTRRVRVLLIEGGPRLLPTFPPALSARAHRDLEELGVECRTGAMVTRLTRDSVYIGQERIAASTVFWAAGNAASPLISAMGIAVDRAGRAMVNADLSVPDHPEVFVIGDAAAVRMGPANPGPSASAAPQQYVPGLAAAANQMGDHAARIIARSLQAQPRRPFRYRDKGSMAVIGRGRAIVDLGRVKLTGILAFYAWVFVHLLYLAGGFRNRAGVMLEWAYAYLTYRPGARLLTSEDVKSEVGDSSSVVRSP